MRRKGLWVSALLAATGLAATRLARPARAQTEALRLGVLTPLTGAGSFDGPRMLKAMQAVAEYLVPVVARDQKETCDVVSLLPDGTDDVYEVVDVVSA